MTKPKAMKLPRIPKQPKPPKLPSRKKQSEAGAEPAAPARERCTSAIGKTKEGCTRRGETLTIFGLRCRDHIPAGHPHCTHSLRSRFADHYECSYCGAKVEAP